MPNVLVIGLNIFTMNGYLSVLLLGDNQTRNHIRLAIYSAFLLTNSHELWLLVLILSVKVRNKIASHLMCF